MAHNDNTAFTRSVFTVNIRNIWKTILSFHHNLVIWTYRFPLHNVNIRILTINIVSVTDPWTRVIIIQTGYLISASGNGAEAGWQDVVRAGANHMVVLHSYSSDSRGALHLHHSARMITSTMSTINSFYGLLEWFAQVLPYLTLLFLYHMIPGWIL